MTDNATPAKVRLTDGLGPAFAAKPIQWRRKHGQWWEDDDYGFCLWQNKDYKRPFFVSWDAGLAAWMLRRKKTREAQFLTMESAQAWCQQQVDDWIRRHTVSAPNVIWANPPQGDKLA